MTDERPRIRVPAGSSARTTDSFQNFAARIGLGTNNLQSAATYGFNPITRNRQLLEWMYGGSWIVGKTVDAVADDMTRAGVEIKTKAGPEDVERLQTALDDLAIWQGVNDTIKWSRLYGGAIGVMLIDGQRADKPLRIATVGRDQFKGIVALDRWMLNPSLNDLITDPGPDLGQPRFYDVVVDGGPLSRQKIHHSRVIRMDGMPQPYWRKISENGWGLSVIEPLYDRLVAFDSTTNGAAQLVHKAHLRTMKIDKLRELIAAGGKAMEGLATQMDMTRLYQTNEGLTLIDAKDEFETHSYTFTGLDSVLLQFAQQLAGATGIPLVRLFGESPAGLNSTGESDIRNYYDGIAALQKARLRRGIGRVLRLVHQSELGRPVDEGFNFKFVPLWQLSETEKADITAKTTTAVTGAFDSSIIGRATALKELRQSADVTGVFSNITDDEITEAEAEPPPTAGEALGEDDLEPGDEKPGDPDPRKAGAKDHIANFALHGLGIVIETPKGSNREGPGWVVTMPAHYGFIQGTWSAEGRGEEMDCFVGPNLASRQAWIVDQIDPKSRSFDEHKIMLGYDTQADAVRDYIAAYDSAGFERIGALTQLNVDELKTWLKEGQLDRPFAARTRDAGEWKEDDHPRRKDGKFGNGGSSSGAGASKSASEQGYGTHHVKKGDVLSFKAKGKELSGSVTSVGPDGAVVRTDGGKRFRVPWAAVTGGNGPRKSTPAAGGFERGEHFIPPEKFNAADFARQNDDANVTAADILAHFPADTAAKIEAAQDRLRSIEQTIAQHKKDGVYDSARKALHRKIIIEGITKKAPHPDTGELVDKHFPGILSPERVKAAAPKDGQAPTFTLLGGRGGSGKNWFNGKVYDENSAIVLDSDHIKSLLPEYEGWNAAQVHAESGEIFDDITSMARQMGLNIVHDATMKSPEKAVALAKQFKAEGYRLEAHYMHLPRQEAAKRAVNRFLGKSQRLVPPQVVLENTENEKSFEAVRKLADAWSFRDNNVPKDDPPILISEGGKS